MQRSDHQKLPELGTPSLGPLSQFFRHLIESLGSLLLGRPASIVPTQAIDRLNQLERREQLKLAERRGDEQFLDQELAKSHLNDEEYRRATRGTTPIASWPEEDFNDLFEKKDQGKSS
jgi:hypothetical protein